MTTENPRNKDLITKEPGSQPVGTGVGAAGGAVAGAALGSMAGPVGTIVGAVVGGVGGALAGKQVGESINPTVGAVEDEHPVGTGVGSATGAIIGGVAGTVAGPIGTAAGAALGAAAGGYAGQTVGEKMDDNYVPHTDIVDYEDGAARRDGTLVSDPLNDPLRDSVTRPLPVTEPLNTVSRPVGTDGFAIEEEPVGNIRTRRENEVIEGWADPLIESDRVVEDDFNKTHVVGTTDTPLRDKPITSSTTLNDAATSGVKRME